MKSYAMQHIALGSVGMHEVKRISDGELLSLSRSTIGVRVPICNYIDIGWTLFIWQQSLGDQNSSAEPPAGSPSLISWRPAHCTA